MKIAIISEWLNVYAGSERQLAEILKIYPQADVFALIHNRKNLIGTPLEGRRVQTSFMQKIPQVDHVYRGLLPLMPYAIESMDVSKYDLVISISHAVAHGVRTHSNQKHIAYVCTPMRYAWHLQDEYLNLHGLNKPGVGGLARFVLKQMREWDKKAALRAGQILAISNWTGQKIQQAWGRESQVIYPPVEVERFYSADERGEYYMLVSRLVPYKMTAEIVKAFNALKLPLMIVGDGPEMKKLQRLAKDNIKLMGYQSDARIAELLSRAKGFVYMAVEDFGIAMVEAQAAGCPVIAYHVGGAGEIVREGTGLLFSEQTHPSLTDAVLQSTKERFNAKAAQENAARFSSKRFRKEFFDYIEPISAGS